MAKEGIDSFLLDCHTNDNISEIEAEFGVKGFAVIVRLWQKIYNEKGYYCEWVDRSPLLFLSNWFGGNSGVTINLINEVVDRCLENGIFSREMYEKHSILTSPRIQQQYFDVVKRREKIEVFREYLLVSVGKIKGIAYINEDSVCRNEENVCRTSTSKGKESKVNYNTESKDSVRQTDVRRVIVAWNSLSDCGIHPVSRLTSSSNRYKWLNARIEEYGIEDVLKAVNSIRQSAFLCGHNKNGWTIDFEWFVRPNNFPKVLEGKYLDHSSDDRREEPSEYANGIWGGARQ